MVAYPVIEDEQGKENIKRVADNDGTYQNESRSKGGREKKKVMTKTNTEKMNMKPPYRILSEKYV